jgi:Bifunctional DNA primase/polymerase, N-terminal
MFAELALRLRDWGSLMPVANPGRRPLIPGWEAYNRAPPTDGEVEAWCTSYPNAGIGLACGPDGLLGVDLDFLEPAVAERGEAIVRETLGQSDCLRIGRPPKRLLLYRAGPGLSVPGKAFGGYEISVRPARQFFTEPTWTQAGHITGPASRPKMSARATCQSSTRPR